MYVILPLAVFAISCLLTLALRRYALARQVMDIPNERSSHVTPTPRGGGLAIVAAFLAAVALLLPAAPVGSRSYLLGLISSGLLVALTGFLDDHRPIAARWRLLGHFIAAAGLLWSLGGLPPLVVFGYWLAPGAFLQLLACIYLVWLLNLYNFMDGIDAIASLEAISIGLGGALLAWLVGVPGGALLPLLLAAATAGFLVWNYPPAKIFMGDAGSGFLGLMIGGLSLQAAWLAPQLLWCWLILTGVFIVDATVTLLHRLIRGEKIYQAHRSHAYQYAARRFGSHQRVSLAVTAINLVWLLPMAVLVALKMLDGVAGLVIAWTPLLVLVCYLGAGRRETA